MKGFSVLDKLRSELRRTEKAVFGKEARKLGSGAWLFLDASELDESIERAKHRASRRIKICLAAGLALTGILGSLSVANNSVERLLVRPDYGNPPKTVWIDVEGKHSGHSVNRMLRIRIPPKLLTPIEASERIQRCLNELHDRILGSNESLLLVRSDLVLPEKHEETGVLLHWESSDPDRIDSEGQVDLLGLVPGETVLLTAVLSLGDTCVRHEYVVSFAPVHPEDLGRSMDRRLIRLADELSRPGPGERLMLPTTTEHGIRLQWRPQKSHLWLLPASAAVLLAALIYLSRLDAIKKGLLRKRRAVEDELPNLSLQLTLLLNAGLVVTAAFDEILRANGDRPHPLYQILNRIRSHCDQTNESFVRALYRFSQTTGSRDFLRLATLVADHASRGSELADKLERERSHLWEGRLQQAQARAKEVETKLCFPLMLLLGVLVVISISPALMEL